MPENTGLSDQTPALALCWLAEFNWDRKISNHIRATSPSLAVIASYTLDLSGVTTDKNLHFLLVHITTLCENIYCLNCFDLHNLVKWHPGDQPAMAWDSFSVWSNPRPKGKIWMEIRMDDSYLTKFILCFTPLPMHLCDKTIIGANDSWRQSHPRPQRRSTAHCPSP